METRLYITKGAPNILSGAAPEPPPKSAPPPARLASCFACQGIVSVLAETCPHCGAPFKHRVTHGVGYYVFWVIVWLCIINLCIAALFGIFMAL
jgi:hypothetical protein